MKTLEELCGSALDAATVERWIGNGWIVARGGSGAWAFDDIDLARLRLVAELHRLEIDDVAIPFVLSLLDQLYTLRRQMGLLREAISMQPDDVREALWAAVVARNDQGPPQS